jgi:hypothetical protein
MGSNGKKMEEQERWSDGQGRRRNGQDARSRRRTQNQGRGGAGISMGSLGLASLGGTCSWRGAAGDCYRDGDSGNGEGGGKNKKLADLANVWRKETREDRDDADERGGQSPVRCLGNLNRGVTRGQ